MVIARSCEAATWQSTAKKLNNTACMNFTK
jgi:hypothetical protein